MGLFNMVEKELMGSVFTNIQSRTLLSCLADGKTEDQSDDQVKNVDQRFGLF